MRYLEKYEEMSFHLTKMEESFRVADGSYLHYFNSFLTSAQSVFFCLNKEFAKHPLYENWKSKRSQHLPETAKVFKELRNVSEKEGPVKNTAVVVGLTLGEGNVLPPNATFTSPMMNTRTGQPLSSKGTITTEDGVATEVEAVAIHDFVVMVESGRKTYRLQHVISDARAYSQAIRREIVATENRFMKKSPQ